MIEKAPISVCLIVKNEPLLEECIKSIRDYVKEIVIVDTGSTDNSTADTARRLADKFEVFTECNNPETGLIEDFSLARQRSFDLATQPWVMWVDADDIITGGEALLEITKSATTNCEAMAVMFKYEYAYNEEGKCTCFHYRERLFSNKNKFHWVNPVHEVVVSNDNVTVDFIINDTVVYKHKRQYSSKVPESGRNLRILRTYFDKYGDSDARQIYYLGLECYNNGLVDEAVQRLSHYVEVSGWDDERTMACLKLVEIFQNIGNYASGLAWGMKAIALKENWGEGYFAIGKMFYFLASQGGPNASRNWERCVHFSRIGLALPPTKTLLFVNPQDREYEIHRYLSIALDRLGDIQSALESTNTGLQSVPNDAALLANKKIYEVWLAKRVAFSSIGKLKELGEVDEIAYDFIGSVLSKNTPLQPVQNNAVWNIPSNCSLEDLPIKITDEQLQSSILMMWKQYMLRDDASSAVTLLEKSTNAVRHMPKVQKALELAKRCLESSHHDTLAVENFTTNVGSTKILDIIFFAGDGVEEWTPETVNRTGIGGSELMLLEMAKRLAALGHKVRVYNSCGFFGQSVYDGVSYLETNKFHDLECDVLVVSRRADMLGDQYNISAKLRLLWVHDVTPVLYTNELLLKADRILCLSEWHKQNVVNSCNVHPNHIIVTRNGIELKRFDKQITRNHFKCINSSSPDRAWPVLLSVWPRIKTAVPQAELHLYYGFKNWICAAQHDHLQMDLIKRLQDQIESMKSLGVIYHDRVNQEQLAEEFLSAGCWTHSTWFTETSCLTGMEAQAAGLNIITSSIAALNETVADRGVLIDGEWTSKEYQDKFVAETIKALHKSDDSERIKRQQYAKDHFCLDKLANNWEKMFFDLIDDGKKHPMRPYQPTAPYVSGKGYDDGDTRLPENHPERRKQ